MPSNQMDHSQKLIDLIRDEIEKNTPAYITFARFMELALYAPGLGYYSAGSYKLGKEGDFVTAPEISPLFGLCLAQPCFQILSELKSGTLLEIGAGSGKLARDLLFEFERLGYVPDQYLILEVSADLRERQQTFLKKSCPHFFERIQWLDVLPDALNGVIIANEVIDAMPVHCFRINEKVEEKVVVWEKNQFSWSYAPASQNITERLHGLTLPLGYESEINLMIPAWIHTLGNTLKKGMLLLADYGYGRNEYYHPDRTQGSLKCFYQHRHHDNPFIHVGTQDITAHVDFTTVVESAMDAGFDLAGYTTQSAFLLSAGLMKFAEEKNLSVAEAYQQNQAIKTLTLPTEMGELIKIMGLTKGVDISLRGFEWMDRRRDL